MLLFRAKNKLAKMWQTQSWMTFLTLLHLYTEDLMFSRVSERVLNGKDTISFSTEPTSSPVSVFDDFYKKTYQDKC